MSIRDRILWVFRGETPGGERRRVQGAVIEWLDLKRYGPRLIAAAGDQVPPGAEEDRIEIMRDLIEQYGRY